MSLSGMTVQDTQPASLLPPLSLSDYSEETAPAGVFAQLLNMFLAPPPAGQIAPPAPAESGASTELSMLPTAAPAAANDPASPVGSELIRTEKKSLGIDNWPTLPANEPFGFTSGESAAITLTLAEPILDTGPNAASAAVPPEIGATPSTDTVGAPPATIAHRGRRDEEPLANELVETGGAETAPMIPTQSAIGVALPAIFDTSGQIELSNAMPQGASPLSKSTGRDGSAGPRAAIIDMPTTAAGETATAVGSRPLELVSQSNDDVTPNKQDRLPIGATKASASSDDRDNLKAPSSRNENHRLMTLSDSFIANATTVVKQSDGMRRFHLTERHLEIDAEPNPSTAGAADGITVTQAAEKGRAGMAARSPGDEHSAAKDGGQGQPREGDAPTHPSMVAGAAPARVHDSDRGETAAPTWRPMVERLARDIGEHFRVGEQQAVLRLDPPELGKVKIDLRIEGGQLHVRIAAEGQESQALIEHHLPELHQALCAGQIDVGAVRVSQGEWNPGGGLAQNFNQSPQGRQESPRDVVSFGVADEVITESSAQPSPRNGDGRVSMWA